MVKRTLPKPGPGKGTLIAGVSSVCAAVGAFAFEFLPHTFFLEKYKSIVRMYRYILLFVYFVCFKKIF